MRAFAAAMMLLTAGAFAQQSTRAAGDQPPLPERMETEWVLRYEQSFGLPGLYVDEPPARRDNPNAAVRRQLVALSKAGRDYQTRTSPDNEPKIAVLKTAGDIPETFAVPEGLTYSWDAERRLFICEECGDASDPAFGAVAQMTWAGEYRERVAEGGPRVEAGWRQLLTREGLPESLRREIETRLFLLRLTDHEGIQILRNVQDKLRVVNDAILFGVGMEMFAPGDEITMQDVAQTGLLATLLALPKGGQYRVSKVGAPPVAVFGERVVPYSETAIADRLREDARAAMERRPDYPPAIAAVARYEEDADRALRLMNEAINLWPDVIALRIQRLAMNARALNLDAVTRDLDYILARFPSAPILHEVDIATRKGLLAADPDFRTTIALTMADIRPEVLNAQLLALSELANAGMLEEAKRLRERMAERHPGFDAVLPSAEAMMAPLGEEAAPEEESAP